MRELAPTFFTYIFSLRALRNVTLATSLLKSASSNVMLSLSLRQL